jgi:hypothetical protein
VRSFASDRNAVGFQNVVNHFSYFGGQPFLNLNAAREGIHDPRKFRNTLRKIANVSNSG